MCSVSAIGDDFTRRFPNDYPFTAPKIYTTPYANAYAYTPVDVVALKAGLDNAKIELARLRNEMTELKQLLLAAKKFDEATGQKDCEMKEKIALIKKVAELVGVDMNEVFT